MSKDGKKTLAPAIEAKSLFKTYKEGSIETEVLKGCSITVGSGEFAAIVGASGAGKSTLLHLLGLLDTADSGEISYGRAAAEEPADESVVQASELNERRRARMRNKEFGFVFQAYHLINELTAEENVLLPAMMRPAGQYLAERGGLKERAAAVLGRIGLGERLRHRPLQLSGGERQRVAIARALMNGPRVLFCDEPTGNLDEQNSRVVFDLLLRLREEEGLTLVLVTHERQYADAADAVYRIHGGKAERE
ncbi:MAG: ABC transporter ATP-binding protein [Planctomycetes bacterium]|nr:ABC transporter ATP-binding protein [Planctomycetota bacterium]